MRLALAPINPTVGDIDGNAALILARVEEARAAGAELVVFPELAVCGYPPKDLLLQEGFVAACVEAGKRIGAGTKGITAVFGLPLPVDREKGQGAEGGIANALLVYRDGRYVEYYDKRLLPTYDVFDENRYFRPGDRPAVVEVGGLTAGLSICEDLWKGEDAGFAWRYREAADPVVEVAAAGAKLLLSPSASPFVLGKGERHREILRRHAQRHGIYVASVNQLGGNDDLLFDGHAVVYSPAGEEIAAGREFEGGMVVVEVGGQRTGPDGGQEVGSESRPTQEELLFRALVMGIRDYLRKTGFRRAVLGVSGGIDSAVVAALAVAAIGAENVIGLAMPGKYSSLGSRTDAYELGKRLGVRVVTVPIDRPFEGFRGAVDAAFDLLSLKRLGQLMPDITEENVQSRVRGTILMTFSNRTGAIVLTTGNKSELAVGYATLYGDMNGGLAPISDIGKVQVYALARWINENYERCGFSRAPIPDGTMTKAPSAELRPDQTDQDSLPPYEVLDEIIARYVERHEAPPRIVRETGFEETVVARVVRLIDLAEYKRKQAAVGLKVTSVAFGSGRRVPIAQGWRGR